MFVGSFEPDDFDQFQTDVQDTFTEFQAAGLTQLIVDLTNNGGTFTYGDRMPDRELMMLPGGFVCLGHFLHAFLSGTNSLGSFPNPYGYPRGIRVARLTGVI